MKKIAVFVFSCIYVFYSQGQVHDTGDKVGIGFTNPDHKLHVNGEIGTSGKNTYLFGANSNEYQALLFAGFGVANGGLFWKGADKTFTVGTGNNNTSLGTYGNANLMVTGNIHSNGNLAIKGATTIDASLTTKGKTTYLWGANGNEYEALIFAGWDAAHGGIFWKGNDRTFTIGTGNDNTSLGAYHNANLLVTGNVQSNGSLNIKQTATIDASLTTKGKTTFLWGANGNEYEALMFAGWNAGHGGIFWKGDDRTFYLNTGDGNHNIGHYGKAHLNVSGSLFSNGMEVTGPAKIKGLIKAKEVQVTNSIDVPDYVFEPDYDLPSLTEVKSYIEKHKHLPEIPSAAEIEKDGMRLGEMNLRLLKKIEELTLHQIQLLEQLQAQNEEMKKMKQRLEKLEK